MRTTRIVVAGILLHDGRLLAARRSSPPELAGRWELPGGKVEPGESEPQALARELLEELGVTARVDHRVGAARPLGPQRQLHAWACGLVAGEPQPLEDHDAVRWLSAEELFDVAWLDADLPAVQWARQRLLEGTALPGGQVAGAVKVHDTVRRPRGPWSPAVHELLTHLKAAGLPQVPASLGQDERGRDVVSFLPGTPLPDAVPSPHLLRQVGTWVTLLQQATREWGRTQARPWRRGLAAAGPAQVICHHDLALGNVLVDGERLVGVVDWDMAGPGEALDDVAYAAWQMVLRHDAAVQTHARAVHALADGYGVDPHAVLDAVEPRMRTSLAVIRTGASRGDLGLAALNDAGVPDALESALSSLALRTTALHEALDSSGTIRA